MKASEERLTKIIQEGKLSPFLIGEEESLNKRPEGDYSRWGELQRFYKTLHPDSPLKDKIDLTINRLYDEHTESKKHAAIAIGRLLQMPSIKQKIIDAIHNSEIQHFGRNLQNEFLFSATILQLSEVSGFVVQKFTAEGRLGEFLMCSSVLPSVDHVGEDEIWRIKVLETFFDGSVNETRESIHIQVQETARYARNFLLAIKKYLSTAKSPSDFHLMLKKVFVEYPL